MAEEKVVFPYRNMTEAVKDRYAQIGGIDQAFRFMRNGYKYAEWYRRAAKRGRDRRRERDQREDAEFLEANPGRTGFAHVSRAAKKEAK